MITTAFQYGCQDWQTYPLGVGIKRILNYFYLSLHAFQPSDLRIFYSGLPSEDLKKKKGKFVAAGMIALFAITYICEQTFSLF
jgi:hypothetical protein